MEEQRSVRIGIKVKGKWTYRHYTTFRSAHAKMMNDLDIFGALQNAAYWTIYKATGKEADDPIASCEAISISLGGD